MERGRATACSGPVLPVVALGRGQPRLGARRPLLAAVDARCCFWLRSRQTACVRGPNLDNILLRCSASIYALSLTLHVSHKKEARAGAPARARAPGLVAVRVWASWARRAPAVAAGGLDGT